MRAGNLDAFSADPGWREAWWWLGAPLVITAFVTAAIIIAPDWYVKYVHPEGYGVLELSHFLVPLMASLMAFSMLFKPYVRRRPLIFAWLLLMALGCFFIAGEEQSWGQHFFYWNTPAYWAELNRQDETNLHNTSSLFNQLPENILLAGVLVGGLVIPLIDLFRPFDRNNAYAIFFPARAIIPAGFLTIAFNTLDMLSKKLKFALFPRTSEVMETFLYLFLLFYMIMLIRRIKAAYAP